MGLSPPGKVAIAHVHDLDLAAGYSQSRVAVACEAQFLCGVWGPQRLCSLHLAIGGHRLDPWLPKLLTHRTKGKGKPYFQNAVIFFQPLICCSLGKVQFSVQSRWYDGAA